MEVTSGDVRSSEPSHVFLWSNQSTKYAPLEGPAGSVHVILWSVFGPVMIVIEPLISLAGRQYVCMYSAYRESLLMVRICSFAAFAGVVLRASSTCYAGVLTHSLRVCRFFNLLVCGMLLFRAWNVHEGTPWCR
ncbi:hypothetical protein PYCCODRAFT_820628 [Trametes coccinea BRFM310]|uniref:Uncharacterized protein n=1 Tax=Trametes coccinea (strain BRFM310) TaxID=1353009 RepID=A0A1Y2IG71_TRAC3|nr:hypothetical protein PYCCODRAFT_820628 [Trametes coccinea BRFM310]